MHTLNLTLLLALAAVALLSGCEDDQRAEDACPPGEQRCPCRADGTCGPSADGEALICEAGRLCVAPECAPGSEGCPCDPAHACEPGLACQSERCEATSCTLGAEGCTCRADNGCDDALVCVDGQCATLTCAPGAEGCVCQSDLTCDAGLACDARTQTCEAIACTPGELGCACFEGECTALEAYCDTNNRCQQQGCPEGEQGCPCAEGGTCGQTEGDEQLMCEGGTCRPTRCPPGETGCVCEDGYRCSQQPAVCDGGYCLLPTCNPGEQGCACLAGGCEPGLVCEGGAVCVDQTGARGGPCRINGTCDRGNMCQGDVCLPCYLGTNGCGCRDDGSCNSGLRCQGDLCAPPAVDPMDSDQPVTPYGCHTPCQRGLVDGAFRPCPPDGLMPGCLDGRVCYDGTCVPPGQVPEPCQEDLDCPEYQACLGGLCQSNCATSDDCSSALRCYKKVCRQPCSPSALCPEESYCDEQDGEFGFCMPAAPESTEEQRTIEGVIGLDVATLSFSNVELSGAFTITNLSSTPQTLQVRKLRHQITFEDASTEFADLDIDNDGVLDVADNCPQIPNLDQINTDGDLLGDACDTNDDNDAHPDSRDNCPLVPNDDQQDQDLNRVGDLCERDHDGDGLPNDLDNCPRAHNPNQEDFDDDGVGDACDRADSVLPCEQDSQCSSNSCDDALGVCRFCNPTLDCPLYWLSLGEPGATAPVQDMNISLAPGERATVAVESDGGAPGPRWSGAIEISHPELGRRIVDLLYEERPEGVWTGNIYYLPNFGTRRLDVWADDQQTRNDPDVQEQVGNALIQRWGAFRRGRITWRNFTAVLTATRTESWRWSSVADDCPTAACYLFDGGQSGLREYSNDLDTVPIPTGAIELPIALNLRMPNPNQAPEQMVGRIDSSVALQYAGDPEVTLTFAGDPTGCTLERPGACLVYVDRFEATIDVGGRYGTTAEDADCARYEGTGGFEYSELPWLVPGFTRDTHLDPQTQRRARSTCRDGLIPFAAQPPRDPNAVLDMNLSLASANPIPDGRTRRRRLELVDGALINQTTLFILFKETFDTFLTPSGQSPDPEDALTTYGYILLERTPSQIDPTDLNGDNIPDQYQGNPPSSNTTQPEGVLQVACSEALLRPILGFDRELDETTATEVVEHLLEGTSATPPRVLEEGDDEQVHYLCEDGELSWFDQGTSEEGRVCPPGARVTYFTVDRTVISDAIIQGMSCQRDLSCRALFLTWSASWGTRPGLMQQEPIYRCADPNAGLCNDDRADLRNGKRFYVAASDQLVMTPLYAATDAAFRYKTRFRNREGTNVGFAPAICAPDSDQLPYCYEPDRIEAIRERVDCLLHIWDAHYDDISDALLAPPDACLCDNSEDCDNIAPCEGGVCDTVACAPRPSTRQRLVQALIHNFSYTETITGLTSTPRIDDGFERLYAELLIMMGDESLTRAFASRFDLAGLSAASFDGESFEGGDGLALSGVAGHEMVSLYQAVQYYQEALDRFYALSPLVGKALEPDTEGSFLTQKMVVWYMERLIRASTQKARSHAEIARRYQSFNKPDLARQVLERAYTGTHLESIIFAQLMLSISDQLPGQDRPQIVRTIEDGQRRYHTALLDMYEVYGAITDESNYFGFAADYIPFPALDTQDFRQSNAFEVLLLRTRTKVQTARERETLALSNARAFDTDAAQFQSELVSIRNNHEDRLAEICGTFEWPEDNPTRAYPAIETYAQLHSQASVLGDPCGLMGNGLIFQELIGFESTALALQQEKLAAQNLREQIDIEQRLMTDQCDAIIRVADFVYESEGEVISLQEDIRNLERTIDTVDRVNATAQLLAQLAVCGSDTTACIQAGSAAGVVTAASAFSIANINRLQSDINDKQTDIEQFNRESVRTQSGLECELAEIQGYAEIARLALKIKEQELVMLKAEYDVRLQLARVQQLRHEAQRLQNRRREAEQLAINVEAARNDPNIRIYKNDAIINADVSFEDALQSIYKLTRVFEYYTSQSYADLDQLFLIRLVSSGDYNLENYLVELENAFYDFEESYGLPDTRVLIVSLRDDIFNIPHIDEDGNALSDHDRYERMRARLRDPALLNPLGHLVFPFKTDLKDVSPLTRNHKIHSIEVKLEGSDLGDTIGRVYLRQKGTGTIHTVTDDNFFYRFPERTAVINTIFNNGREVFGSDVFRNYRLRDRPLLNTHWELVINQRDETANQDINLQSLTDIRIYIFYNDFTDL
ncbi:MAG: hypothetical protein CMH57_05265 [Myxococcales bacterium]|nr:hypothetical protein [Myxococcales bacterium]